MSLQPTSSVVRDLIPVRSVNIAVGDTGLGKTAWMFQLGLCVANGVPFLGMQTEQGRVLHVDLENMLPDIGDMCCRIERYLGIEPSDDHMTVLTHTASFQTLERLIRQQRPVLVVIDSLWSFRPDVLANNHLAASLISKLRRNARKYDVAFLLIDKPRNATPSLECTAIMTWLVHACGDTALVNATDVRLAFDAPAVLQRRLNASKPGEQLGDEVALVVKGFAPLLGEFGPIYLGRVFNEDGEPMGYERLEGAALLFNSEPGYEKALALGKFARSPEVTGK